MYLRKEGKDDAGDDDALLVKSAIVYLLGPDYYREFACGQHHIGMRYGSQVWLKEVIHT